MVHALCPLSVAGISSEKPADLTFPQHSAGSNCFTLFSCRYLSRRWSHCSYSQLPDLKDLESQLSFHLACCALPPGQTSTLHPGHTNSNHNKNPQSQYGVAPTLHKSHLNLLLVFHLWQTRASIPSCVAHDCWKPTRDLSSTASRSHTRRAPTHRQGRATLTTSQVTLLLLKLKPQSSRREDKGQV